MNPATQISRIGPLGAAAGHGRHQPAHDIGQERLGQPTPPGLDTWPATSGCTPTSLSCAADADVDYRGKSRQRRQCATTAVTRCRPAKRAGRVPGRCAQRPFSAGSPQRPAHRDQTTCAQRRSAPQHNFEQWQRRRRPQKPAQVGPALHHVLGRSTRPTPFVEMLSNGKLHDVAGAVGVGVDGLFSVAQLDMRAGRGEST